MKVELTEEEVQQTVLFLNRVNIQGSEALPLVLLRQKYTEALKPKPPPEEA